MAEQQPPAESDIARGHEHIETNVFRVAVAAGALLLTVALAMVLMAWMVGLLESNDHDGARRIGSATRQAEDTAESASPEADTRPDVQPNQAYHTRQQRMQMEQVLRSYGWVKPGERIARIPIDRAMQIVSRRGLEPWQTEQSQTDDTQPGNSSRTPDDTDSPPEEADDE